MEVNYVHKDTLTATEYVELNKNNELPISYNQVLLKENQEKSYFLIYEDEKEYLKLSSRRAYIRRIILEEVLQKYKSIIGVSDEKEN